MLNYIRNNEKTAFIFKLSQVNGNKFYEIIFDFFYLIYNYLPGYCFVNIAYISSICFSSGKLSATKWNGHLPYEEFFM